MTIHLKITSVAPVTRGGTLHQGTGKVLDIQESADTLLDHIESGNLLEAQTLLANLASSKKIGIPLRKEFAVLANMVTSTIESKTIFKEDVSLDVHTKIKRGILASLEKMGQAEERAIADAGKSRADKALDAAEQLFASPFTAPHSPEAQKLKRHLTDRGMSVGTAPIVFVMNSAVSVEQLKLHFTSVSQTQGYLVIEGLNVIGVNQKFVDERGFSSAEDGLELMATTWNAKHANRYHVFDTYAMWSKALWALAVQKSDMRILNQAAGGRFRYRRWGLAFNT